MRLAALDQLIKYRTTFATRTKRLRGSAGTSRGGRRRSQLGSKPSGEMQYCATTIRLSCKLGHLAPPFSSATGKRPVSPPAPRSTCEWRPQRGSWAAPPAPGWPKRPPATSGIGCCITRHQRARNSFRARTSDGDPSPGASLARLHQILPLAVRFCAASPCHLKSVHGTWAV